MAIWITWRHYIWQKKIYNSCKSRKDIYIVHGAGHTENYKKDPEGYEKIITTFIKENVSREER